MACYSLTVASFGTNCSSDKQFSVFDSQNLWLLPTEAIFKIPKFLNFFKILKTSVLQENQL